MKHSGMMALVNAYKEEMERRYSDRLNRSFVFCEQWYADMAILAAAEVFQADPDRLREFATRLEKDRNSFVDKVWNADTKDAEYSMSVLDRSLEQVCGKYFLPHEKRYQDKVWLLRGPVTKEEMGDVH